MDYLGNMKVSMFVTDSVFLKKEYNDESVKRFSKFYVQ